MAEPQDTITLVNSTEDLSAAQILRAKAILDEHAPAGKTDVLQARERLWRMANKQGVELPPNVEAPKTPAPSSTATNVIAGVIVLGVLFGVGACIVSVVNNTGSDGDDAESGADEIGASVICEQFVEDRLRSPGTADFASYPDQVVTGGPTQFVVRSYVDSENGFGALLRTDYTCTVSSTDGDRWTLVDLVTSGG